MTTLASVDPYKSPFLPRARHLAKGLPETLEDGLRTLHKATYDLTADLSKVEDSETAPLARLRAIADFSEKATGILALLHEYALAASNVTTSGGSLQEGETPKAYETRIIRLAIQQQEKRKSLGLGFAPLWDGETQPTKSDRDRLGRGYKEIADVQTFFTLAERLGISVNDLVAWYEATSQFNEHAARPAKDIISAGEMRENAEVQYIDASGRHPIKGGGNRMRSEAEAAGEKAECLREGALVTLNTHFKSGLDATAWSAIDEIMNVEKRPQNWFQIIGGEYRPGNAADLDREWKEKEIAKGRTVRAEARGQELLEVAAVVGMAPELPAMVAASQKVVARVVPN